MIGWCYDLRDDLPDQPRVQTGRGACTRCTAEETPPQPDASSTACSRSSADSSADAWTILASVEFFEGHFERAIDCQMRAYEIAERDRRDERSSASTRRCRRSRWRSAVATRASTSSRPSNAPASRAGRAGWRSRTTPPAWRASSPIRRRASTRSTVRSPSRSRSATATSSSSPGATGSRSSGPAPTGRAGRGAGRRAATVPRDGRHDQRACSRSGTSSSCSPMPGGPSAAALICGWLDGRTGRASGSLDVHETAVAAVRRSRRGTMGRAAP